MIASIGTMVGTIVGFLVLNQWIPHLAKIGAMMTGSYIGGGVNFAALSSKFATPSDMISSTVVADNSIMALYFMLLIALPSLPWIKDISIRTMTALTLRQRNSALHLKRLP